MLLIGSSHLFLLRTILLHLYSFSQIVYDALDLLGNILLIYLYTYHVLLFQTIDSLNMFLYFLFSLIYYLIFLYFFLAVHLLLFLVLFSLLLHSLYFLYLLDRIARLPLVICFSNIHHNLSDWYIFLNEINLIQILLYLSIQLLPWYMMLHLPLWKYFLFLLSYMCNLCNMLHLPIIFDYLYIVLKM